MTDHQWILKLEDRSEEGWPFPIMSVNELELIDCPRLVIPAGFKARDSIIIKQGEIRIAIVFDGSVLVMITGAKFSHILAEQKIGKRLADLIGIAQLRDHPVSRMTIDNIEVLENGEADIELTR